MKHGKKASKGHAKGSQDALKSQAGSKGGKKVAAEAVKKAEKPLKAVKAQVEAARPKGGEKAAPAAKGVKAASVKAAGAKAPAATGSKGSAQGSAAGDSRNKAAAVSGGLRPDVAAAFARALKKYPDALRRLAD
jgi:hypothetical protein